MKTPAKTIFGVNFSCLVEYATHVFSNDQRQSILVGVEIYFSSILRVGDYTCVVELPDRCGGADGSERETSQEGTIHVRKV